MKKIFKLNFYILIIILFIILIFDFSLSRNETISVQATSDYPPTMNYITNPPNPRPTEVTISAVGDILMHSVIINSYKNDNYDFYKIFKYVSEFIQPIDYSIANLEVTTAGNDYPYSGYPIFNCPDTIFQSLKKCGFDMLLGANNHRMDTGSTGFYRTIEKSSQYGLAQIGVKENLDDISYKVIDIKGIKVGFSNYTYHDGKIGPNTNINGIPVPTELNGLIDIFNQSDLNSEKIKFKNRINEMKEAGAEVIVFFLHWGQEYMTEPTPNQKDLAQFLCNEGVDVIIGSHPHVLEPTEILYSKYGNHKTLVAYSLGNFISDQRLETVNNIATEWGSIFTFTLLKDNVTNTVLIKDSSYIPTWVRKTKVDGNRIYEIIPTDKVNSIDNLTGSEIARIEKAKTGVMDIMWKYSKSTKLYAEKYE